MTQSVIHTLLLAATLLAILVPLIHSYTNPISCYTCEWDQKTGCKRTGKVNKKYLETNCTVCYKNVIPYKEGLAAAKGSRRCLQEADVINATGYTGKDECWMVSGSLHCYCTKNKCNHAETGHINYILLLVACAVSTLASRIT